HRRIKGIVLSMKAPETLQQAIVYFSDPERAFEYAKMLRWPDGKVSCPRCGSEKNSFIKTRRLWFCYGCQKQFTLKVGTIFEDSALGLDKWMTAFWMLANCRNGVSSYEIARDFVEPGSAIMTDEFTGYSGLESEYQRQFVNHLEKYVDGQVHVQGVENFWSCLKRSLGGTYIAVEPFHLFRYVDEQAFRFNNRKDALGRKLPDAMRFTEAMSRVAGHRLTYSELTGKSDSPHHPATG